VNAMRAWLSRQPPVIRAGALFLFLAALFALLSIVMPGMNLLGPGVVAALVAAIIELFRGHRSDSARHG
jgi:hypothetical protein